MLGGGRDRGVQRFHHADRGEHRGQRPPARRPRRRPSPASPPWATTPWSSARWPWRASGSAAAPSRSASTSPRDIRKSSRAGCGEITVGRKTHRRDIYIHVNGKVKKRAKSLAQAAARPAAPDPPQGTAEGLPRRAGNPLRRRRQGGKDRSERRSPAVLEPPGDSLEVLPTAQAVEAYNRSKQRKAALMHVTC